MEQSSSKILIISSGLASQAAAGGRATGTREGRKNLSRRSAAERAAWIWPWADVVGLARGRATTDGPPGVVPVSRDAVASSVVMDGRGWRAAGAVVQSV